MSDQTQSPKQPPKLTFEKVFDRLRLAIDEALDDCPELRSVAVVTDWEIGATEFPFGIMLGRSGPVRSPVALQGITAQTVKMLYHQCQVFTELLASADDLAQRLGEEIKKREQHIRDREDHLRRVEEAINAGTARLPGPIGATGPSCCSGPAGYPSDGHGGVAAAVGEHPHPNSVGGPTGP